jgi:hypothetical protein
MALAVEAAYNIPYDLMGSLKQNLGDLRFHSN